MKQTKKKRRARLNREIRRALGGRLPEMHRFLRHLNRYGLHALWTSKLRAAGIQSYTVLRETNEYGESEIAIQGPNQAKMSLRTLVELHRKWDFPLTYKTTFCLTSPSFYEIVILE